MASIEEVTLQEINELIDNDRLVLPTLPEVALKARETAEDPNASAGDLAKVINNDAAMTARIIKVANSPIMRGAREIEDVQMAIARLGITCISNLVTGLAMEQMFQATSDLIDKTMRESWHHSTEVAGIANVICKHYTNLKPDQATLAGLVHEIGVLPILTYAEESDRLNDPITLQKVIHSIHPKVGVKILQSWEFPKELIDVPAYYRKFNRDTGSDKPDYVDVVMVANLQTYMSKPDHPYITKLNWHDVTAFNRVGLDPNIGDNEDEDLNAEMEAAMAMLQAN
ncbi:MAG: histidine kinase [Pseudomonadales bacterium]|uniref:HDOD domain-containing protein n=1 Tax=unclassified Ketobacter TaxID=2639109 RepID=UPI000C8C5C9F|nr:MULTISPECIES: HDOD domain-containing protein [unclassified Ketobacter]MAQ27167.1 histidine kinase [Pseudomonadales bacterium]MEC8813644.1 HDOD domain-containing protein [Pseudomonadota bacterium]TNC89623.1 MAG: histidine kinase [Alcanivorax sp.]HAG96133.1 histidine kinase [Gammaproteobacteria bacterium]MCK5789564.1 HDOD domain-containing protein [Ketobacter sp.]